MSGGHSNMKLQVLVATMHQKGFDKVKEMNIHSDVLFANQTDYTSYEEEKFEFGIAKMVSTETRGVGINRNIGLLYADGDYLLFSDDDLKYVDGYDDIVKKAFEDIPDADAIMFNIYSSGVNTYRRSNKKIKRIRWHEALNYGAIRIAVKRKSIKRENVMFNLNFGGGALYSSGEDTMFVTDMMKKGLKLYAHPAYIATVNDDRSNSSWFKGYNAKFYYDKGVFFRSLSKRFTHLLCLQFIIRHKDYKTSNMRFNEAYSYMKKGIKGYKNLDTME